MSRLCVGDAEIAFEIRHSSWRRSGPCAAFGLKASVPVPAPAKPPTSTCRAGALAEPGQAGTVFGTARRVKRKIVPPPGFSSLHRSPPCELMIE
jgi:hypothetical protein